VKGVNVVQQRKRKRRMSGVTITLIPKHDPHK
jgi:hypothetical protein